MNTESLRQATEKARDPEVVARLVDPGAWKRLDAEIAHPTKGHNKLWSWEDYYRLGCRESLTKARAIIALFPDTLPLIEALEGAELKSEELADRLQEHMKLMWGAPMKPGEAPCQAVPVGLLHVTIQHLRAIDAIRRTLNHD